MDVRICCVGLLAAVSVLNLSCNKKNADRTISVVWEDWKATAVAIPIEYLGGIPSDSISDQLHVRLVGQKGQFILGKCSVNNDEVLFRPVVPLTKGLTYEVLIKQKSVGVIDIKNVDQTEPPKLLAIYPSNDSLPENLLKMYLQFSTPMHEGESLSHISLIENNRDTLKNVFLDLKPELWNSEGTLLTLWLDPGRIKRDLKPNLTLGNPLKENKKYTLAISSKWRSTEGKTLVTSFAKHFFVMSRDETLPDVERWKITEPQASTKAQLRIDFHEPLDYSLLKETFRILDSKGNSISGTGEVADHERGFLFMPVEPWQKGEYQIAIEGCLEDLAGNNLNRPFDRDLKKSEKKDQKEVFTKRFKVN